MIVSTYDFTVAIVAIFITWSLYTQFLGKPTPFRSLAENAYIGVGMGMVTVINIWYMWTEGISPILRGEYWMLSAIILSIMMFSRITPKYNYIARVPLTIAVGTSLGLALRTQINSNFILQVKAMIIPLWVDGNLYQTISNLTNVIGGLLLITFFIYTTEQKGPLKHSSQLGEYVLYIGLGTLFAQTFMGRLSMFTGYMQQITDPQWKIPYTIGIALLVFAASIIMDRRGLLEKYG